MKAKNALISAATVTLAVAACHTAAEVDIGTASTTSANVASNDAADQIVKAHCTHFYGCNELGANHMYGSYDECERGLKGQALHSQQCRNKQIAQSKLTACLDAIRTTGCARGHNESFAACSDQTLCR
jgi:hypothetical protein